MVGVLRLRPLLLASGLLLVAASACKSESSLSSGNMGGSAGDSSEPADPSKNENTGGMGGSRVDGPTARVRLVGLSSGVALFDLCAAAEGPPTIRIPNYGKLGDPVSVPAGKVQFRAVSLGTDCASDVGIPTSPVTLKEGGNYTLVVLDELFGEGTLPVYAYSDTPVPGPATASVRFIHASFDTPNVDVGDEVEEELVLTWEDVAPGENVSPISVDEGPYVELPVQRTFRVYEQGTTSELYAVEDLELTGGTATTLFLVGNYDGWPEPLRLLVCVDSAKSSSCTLR